MNKKVSVIIPVYNVEKFLHKCIDSVVNQTYKNIEIILIDDGSPDNCPAICDNRAASDRRIKVLHQQNSGLSAARNKGIDISVGDYICFVDSDDFIAENMIEKAVSCIEKNDADIVCFGVFRVNEFEEILESTETMKEKCVNCREAILDLSYGKIHDYAWSKLYKRKVFENVRYPVGRAFEDIATTYKTFLNSKKICYLPQELYFYRKRKGSIIDNMKESSLNDLFVIRKERYDFFKEKYPEAAKACFEMTAISALNFYDISLWTSVNTDTLNDAIEFLENNKTKASKISGNMKLYSSLPFLYKIYRRTKHFIGNIIKAILVKKK